MFLFDERFYFDDRGQSELWEATWRHAEPFIPLAVHEIELILPHPTENGSLILTIDSCFRSPNTPLKVLQGYADVYSFSDYKAMSTCLKSFRCFGQYKSSWICPFFTLCPLEGIDQTMWINPFSVCEIETKDGILFAALQSGHVVSLPIQRRSFIQRIELSCLALAAWRRECFYFSIQGTKPLDYLPFPDERFSKLLKQRAALQYFTIPYGELFKRYQQTLLLLSYEEFEDDFS